MRSCLAGIEDHHLSLGVYSLSVGAYCDAYALNLTDWAVHSDAAEQLICVADYCQLKWLQNGKRVGCQRPYLTGFLSE